MKSMTEKELEELLKKQTDEILVPESLRPENMVKRIKNETKAFETKTNEVGKASKFRKWMYRVSASAAVFLCGGLIAYGGIYGYGKWNEKQTGKELVNRDSLCMEVIDEANQISSEFAVQKEWYEWAKKYGVDSDARYYFDGYYGLEYNEMEDMVKAEGVVNSTSQPAKGEATAKDDYSTTNVQVEGIDEADIIKTDGQYLYILSEGEIYIVDTKEELTIVGSIPLEERNGYVCQEMYVKDEQLIVIEKKKMIYFNGCINEEEPVENEDEIKRDSVKVLIYSIQNKEKPELVKELEQDGYYLSSRVNGDYLYLFTEYTTFCPDDIEDFNAYVPNVCDEELKYQDVCVMAKGDSARSLLVSAINLKDHEVKDKIMLTSGSEVFYVSEEAIYSAVTIYKNSGEYTELVKISYHEGELEYVGKTEIEGYIIDQYYMDEKDGFLRVVVQTYNYDYEYAFDDTKEDIITMPEEVSRLYVLDKDLNEVGRIDDVAKDERLYSCRFMGDMVYFVTFRQVDPLFAADLSDPYHPVLTGQLKIPGFSEYLQPYGEGLLLGIGYDADEETGRKKGVKLTMFDIHNPADITELTSTYLPECYYVVSDAKAILANADKNLIGITTYRYDGDEYYYCFSYEDGEFVTNMQEEISVGSTRGIYIGDVLYVSNQMEVKAISLNDYVLIETLKLSEN